MRLRRNQLCPIHRSLACCGREAIPKEKRARQLGVRRIEDPQHPRGYQEIRSNAEMRKLMERKIAAQNGICALCKERFTDYSDIVPDHISPRGMGGAWRDDHPDNIQAVHWWCNGEEGSKNLLKFTRLRRLSWRFSFLPVRNLFEVQFCPVLIGVFGPQWVIPEACNPDSGTLLPESCRVVEPSVAATGSDCAPRN